MSVSLILIKVQTSLRTAKLGYQFSDTTNLTKGKEVSLPLLEELKGPNVCEKQTKKSRPRVHLHGTSKGSDRKNLNMHPLD